LHSLGAFSSSELVFRTQTSVYIAATLRLQTGKEHNKPVGDGIFAPSPNFVAVATRVGPTTFCMDPNIFGLSAIQAEL